MSDTPQPTPQVNSVCSTCRLAEWDKTANGRRHPNGIGRCTYELPDGALPKWFIEWSYAQRNTRVVSLRQYLAQKFPVRQIYWRESHRIEAEPCATWEAK